MPLLKDTSFRQLRGSGPAILARFVPHLQALVPDGPGADRLMANARQQAASIDANDILYSLKSSADYDPEPGLTSIRTKVFALNFDDDEFNPEMLRVLEQFIPRVEITQSRSPE
jgi:homoserine O-acetyltransferase/O-succinyltransferase